MNWYTTMKESTLNNFLLSKQAAHESYGNWESLSDGRLIGYRISRFDPETSKVISGSNSRLSWDVEPGTIIRLESPGLFLTNSKQYAKDYYLVHDHNILQGVAFNPEDVTTGELSDKEPEVSISVGEVVSSSFIDM